MANNDKVFLINSSAFSASSAGTTAIILPSLPI